MLYSTVSDRHILQFSVVRFWVCFCLVRGLAPAALKNLNDEFLENGTNTGPHSVSKTALELGE